MMYDENILTRFNDLKHCGTIKNAVQGVSINASYDSAKIYVKIEDNIIVDASFKVLGCIASVVGADIICDMILNKTVDDALSLTAVEVAKKMPDLEEDKFSCAGLLLSALKDAISVYRKKQLKEMIQN